MTIKDIAKLSGVSVSTVSRVLNDSGYVKEETRKNVEEIISKYNFRPNAIARSLIKSETSLIAVIMPGRMNPFMTHILDAIEECADIYGHSVLFYNTNDDADRERRAVEQALEHRVTGILILPVIGTKVLNELEAAKNDGIPVILVDREIPGASFDAVIMDNRKAVYDAMQLLLKNGHKSIGIITAPEVVEKGTRLDGYMQALREQNIEIRDDLIYNGDFNEESGYKACEQFLSLPNAPTAILVSYSSGTIGCIRYMNEHKIRPGRDIGLVGFDDISTLNQLGYQITVVDRPKREMGKLAYELLVDRLNGSISSARCRECLMDAKLHIRGSEFCSLI